MAGGGKYSCRDVWGGNGGTYTIYKCDDCRVALGDAAIVEITSRCLPRCGVLRCLT